MHKSIGDHGCEYMTGGTVTVLGRTGINFGAGMSGGVAYVFDIDGDFTTKCNMEMIELEGVRDEVEQAALKAIVEEHHQRTGSSRAADILASWNESVGRFVKVIPTDYKRMLGYIEQARETQQYGSEEEIVDAAFDMHLANLAK